MSIKKQSIVLLASLAGSVMISTANAAPSSLPSEATPSQLEAASVTLKNVFGGESFKSCSKGENDFGQRTATFYLYGFGGAKSATLVYDSDDYEFYSYLECMPSEPEASQ